MADLKTTSGFSDVPQAGADGVRSARGRVVEGIFGGGASRFLGLFVLLFGLGMAVITLVGSQGWLAYQNLETEASTLREDVIRLKDHQQELKREMNALRNDPGYIELLARQRLGLARPGERVIQLPTDKSREQQP